MCCYDKTFNRYRSIQSWFITVCCWSVLWSSAQAAPTLKAVDLSYHHRDDRTRLVLTSDQAIEHRFFVLTKPLRYVIDIKRHRAHPQLKLPKPRGPVAKIRMSQSQHKLRLVLDMKQAIPYREFKLKHPHRLVFDLQQSARPGSKPPNSKSHPSPPPYLREVVVLLDPGHGGRDPGAVGARGTREKDVVLAIAKKLKRYVDQQPGMRAVLTRSTDRYIPLRTRLKKARASDSDLFISIHADAFKIRRYYGSSVYALSQRGASSEAARWLAEKENHSELGGIDLTDKNRLLRSVLIDLSQTVTIDESLRLGQHILTALGKVTSLRSRKVEQAPFVVLKSPDIPSLLIETGFISNRKEELKLRHPAHQDKLARAMLKGIRQYFFERPLQNTIFAQKEIIYQVRRGDHLTRLAKRFGITVKQLKAVNRLTSDQLRIGQKLTIPRS